MIADSVGASPFGIFLLGDEYLGMARLAATFPRATTFGPARLLAYHACELYLKTYLRSQNSSVTELRGMGHNLPDMAASAIAAGLHLDTRIVGRLATVEAQNDYVKARYTVVSEPGALKIETALDLGSSIRETVRIALDYDEFGMPRGEVWPAGEPSDLLLAQANWLRDRLQN